MAVIMTEDEVRDQARDLLGFADKEGVRSGVGQTTTFISSVFPAYRISQMAGTYRKTVLM